MPCLPIHLDELAAFETKLKVKLPEAYKERISDPRVQKVLSHQGIGMLDLSCSMDDFAHFTEAVRARYPEFPQDGVVISTSFDLEKFYDRFLVPDKHNPQTLGNAVYSWGKQRRKKIRDCSIDEFFDMPISCAPEGLLGKLGLEKKAPESKAPFKIKSCDEPVRVSLGGYEGSSSGFTGPNLGEWVRFSDINITGRYLVPCDLGKVPQAKDSPAVQISPGRYRVEIQSARSRLGNWGIIAAVRILKSDANVFEPSKVFDVDVDLGAISIFDRQAFFKRVPLDDRDAFCSDLLDVAERPFRAVAGKTEVIVIPSGDGDGSYPVYELSLNGEPVGMEIRFVDDNVI